MSERSPCDGQPLASLDFRLIFAYAEIVPSSCRVSFTDTEGITHTAVVTASSLYEAAALGVAEFRRCGLIDASPGPVTMLSVAVGSPSTRHEVPMRKLMAWLESSGRSPREQATNTALRGKLQLGR
jgi:hypothetical protein